MFQRTHSLQMATDELAVEVRRENEYQALHDALTGLPNRMFFHQQLIDGDRATRGAPTGSMAVMLMDLDHFKEINDTLGHHFGDMLLQRDRTAAVERAARQRPDGAPRRRRVRHRPARPARATTSRCGSPSVCSRSCEHPVSVEGLALDVVGLASASRSSRRRRDDAETLLRRADVAMYAAKEAGGGVRGLSRARSTSTTRSRLTLIGQVRPALENGEFVVYYQPKVRLSDGRVAGAEALVRWNHPGTGSSRRTSSSRWSRRPCCSGRSPTTC